MYPPTSFVNSWSNYPVPPMPYGYPYPPITPLTYDSTYGNTTTETIPDKSDEFRLVYDKNVSMV